MLNIGRNRQLIFPKSQKLISKKEIDLLFKEGDTYFKFPYKVVYPKPLSGASAQFPKILISVSKKYFKHAHDRNRLKRLIREAYRLQKPELIKLFDHIPNSFIIIYTSKTELTLEQLKKKLYFVFENIATINKNNDSIEL
jgi:ribonuclease P protein component